MQNQEIIKAIIAVMSEVRSIDKNTTVGSGNYAYKGVSDKDVKFQIGQAMQKNGLCVIPIDIDSTVRIERWEETTQYGNKPPVTKQKQQVFNEVKTRYKLLHVSGESLEFVGSGHGVDTMDKAAGKSTTYALKYALLYLFMVPTGHIDDADTGHSNDKEIAPAKPKQPAKPKPKLATGRFAVAIAQIKKDIIEPDVLNPFALTKEQQTELAEVLKAKL